MNAFPSPPISLWRCKCVRGHIPHPQLATPKPTSKPFSQKLGPNLRHTHRYTRTHTVGTGRKKQKQRDVNFARFSPSFRRTSSGLRLRLRLRLVLVLALVLVILLVLARGMGNGNSQLGTWSATSVQCKNADIACCGCWAPVPGAVCAFDCIFQLHSIRRGSKAGTNSRSRGCRKNAFPEKIGVGGVSGCWKDAAGPVSQLLVRFSGQLLRAYRFYPQPLRLAGVEGSREPSSFHFVVSSRTVEIPRIYGGRVLKFMRSSRRRVEDV